MLHAVVAVVVDQVNRGREPRRVDDRGHRQQHGVDPPAQRIHQRQADRRAVHAADEHHGRQLHFAQIPPGQAQAHDGRQAHQPQQHPLAFDVDGHVIDRRAAEVNLRHGNLQRPGQRVVDLRHGGPQVLVALGRQQDRGAGLLAVGPHERTLQPVDGLLAGQIERRTGQLRDQVGAGRHALEVAGVVSRRGEQLFQLVEPRVGQRAPLPTGQHEHFLAKLQLEPFVFAGGLERVGQPLLDVVAVRPQGHDRGPHRDGKHHGHHDDNRPAETGKECSFHARRSGGSDGSNKRWDILQAWPAPARVAGAPEGGSRCRDTDTPGSTCRAMAHAGRRRFAPATIATFPPIARHRRRHDAARATWRDENA